MTLADTVAAFARTAVEKRAFLRRNPLGFAIAAMMAGAYVGMGILLVFSIGQTIDPSVRALVMGACFGVALTLVIFAGSELFTGHAMYMTIGRLRGAVGTGDLLAAWGASWTANLAGSALLGGLFVLGGGGSVLGAGGQSLIHEVAAAKMAAPALELFARGVLCNWLVCLAIWCSARTDNDAAKCIVIFWCLFAFIAAGFEHSVANMTVFAVALIAEHPEAVSVPGALRNLVWVTLGNAFSGAALMGGAYWIAAGRPRESGPPGEDGAPRA